MRHGVARIAGSGYTFFMSATSKIEALLLRLPASARERLALLAWDSLGRDQAWLADPTNDPEGIALARKRDQALDAGAVVGLTHEEFVRRRVASADEA